MGSKKSHLNMGLLVIAAVMVGCGIQPETPKPEPAVPILPAKPITNPDQTIRNFRQINERLATAGQPTKEGLKQVAEAGYKTIMNLRTPEEGSLEEQRQVEALGVRYVNIPITSQSITPEKVEAFSAVVRDSSNYPLLIHCRSANRVGGLWMIHRVLKDGLSPEQAEQEAEQIGLKSAMLKEVVKAYLATHRAEPKQ